MNWFAYLPIVVVLPVPFTPTTRTTCGFLAAIDFQWLGDRRENLLDLLGQNIANLFGGNVAVIAGFAQSIRYAGSDIDAKVGLDEQVFQLLQGFVVQLPLDEDAGYALGEPRRCFRQPLAQALKPAEACFLQRLVFHFFCRLKRPQSARLIFRLRGPVLPLNTRPNTSSLEYPARLPLQCVRSLPERAPEADVSYLLP